MPPLSRSTPPYVRGVPESTGSVPHLPCDSGAVTVKELADELGVDPGDVRVLLAQLGAPDTGGPIDTEYAVEVRDQVDHFCERSVPAVWWPGSDPDAGRGATKMR